MQLSSKERIMRLFRNQEVDRPALKLWGASPDQTLLHPHYGPVRDLAAEISDLFVCALSPFNVYCGRYADSHISYYLEDTAQETWKDQHCIYHTPEGDLHGVERISTVGEPSYTLEYPVKEPEDLRRIMTLPYEAYPFDTTDFARRQAQLGERGVVMLAIDHAGHALQRLIGSENLAIFSIDCRQILEEALALFSSRIRDHVQRALAAGIRAPFHWVGPEVFIPPLMAPADFEDFVYRWDKPLCDDIHEGGGHVWVHCHGKVANFIERYIQMGVDILNPLEPPKNGDIALSSVIARYGNRIGWEGNVEIQDILQDDADTLREKIAACVEQGQASGRFILCPSAGYMEYPFPEKRYIDNLLLYLQYGLECVEKYRKL